MFQPTPEISQMKSTTSERHRSHEQTPPTSVYGDPGAAKQTGTVRLCGFPRDALAAVTTIFAEKPKKGADGQGDKTVSDSEKGPGMSAPASNSNRKQRLRAVPFTSSLFRTIVRRMSIHSWIIRLISRANVPAFERTLTEMPLYSESGKKLGPRKAICEFDLMLELNDSALKTQQYTTAAHRMSGKVTWRCLLRISQQRN